MRAPALERTSAGKAAWLVGLIFIALLVFILVPGPHPDAPAPSPGFAPVAAESKLEAAGLGNNPDWVGLPEYFAVWADALAWRDDKVVFAYWNPGSQSYSYFFEATRQDNRYRFRAVTLRELETHSADYFGVDDPMSFAVASQQNQRSSSDPFIFFSPLQIAPPTGDRHGGILWRKSPVQKLDIRIQAEPLKVPLSPDKDTHDSSK